MARCWGGVPSRRAEPPDASEQFLGLLAIFVAHGHVIVDTETNEPAGQLGPFLRSGLLDEDKPFPLSMLQQITYEANCSELAFMAHNAVLTMRPWRDSSGIKGGVGPYSSEFVACLGEIS